MEITTSFVALAEMHPQLEWEDITAATVSVLDDCGLEAPYRLPLEFLQLPGFGNANAWLIIDRAGIAADRIARVRRTYESLRRIELAAIAVAALGLYHGGRHEIVDVAVRGSGADYLVDAEHQVLEIAGRSRRSDFESAWQQRRARLTERKARGFYLCVVEFETPTARLAFEP